MKISLLCFDLAHNCLGRTYLLAQVLSRRHQVEILGPSFGAKGREIWGPCASGEFEYFSVPGGKLPGFLKSMRQLRQKISGDVIYACKPRLPSFGVALRAKRSRGVPVILDIDDEEMAFFTERDWRRKRKLLRNPLGPLYSRWMAKRIPEADAITTVSRTLQQRYGGVLVPHGRDPQWLDAGRFDRAALRSQHGLSDKKVVMFLGTARPHKGLEDLVAAGQRLDRPDLLLFFVGKGAQPDYEQSLSDQAGEMLRWHEEIPFSRVPEFLVMADAVVIPQRENPGTEGQIPAKLMDAMAMARPIVATRVSDLPEILENCGYLANPGDPASLAAALKQVFDDPEAARQRGERARERCEQQLSLDVMESRLEELLKKVTQPSSSESVKAAAS